MKRSILYLILIGALAISACSAKEEPVNQEKPVQENPVAVVDESAAIAELTNAKKAVVQIESQGTFVDPEFGLVVNNAGRGSGFLIDQDGLIVTNNHVVTGAALIKVFLGDETYNAKILGSSECADLAVIKIEGGPFDYLEWYDGDVSTGLEVYSAGFPLGDPEFTLTKGIISKEEANGDTYWSSLNYVLEHDATINPGNSGGPLITNDAKVVGVNYRVYKEAGQNFAIDQKLGKPVIDKLIEGEDVYSIGINGSAVMSEDGSISGIWVASVESGSVADKAGIKAGDVIYQLENLVLATDGSMKDYCDILKTHDVSDTLNVTIIRYDTGEVLEGQLNGRELEVTSNFDTTTTGQEQTADTGNLDGSDGTADTSGVAPDFYLEEFDGDVSNYSYFEFHELIDGKEPNPDFAPTIEDGFINFTLNETDKYVYVYYAPYYYQDVAIGLKAVNKGANSIMTSLMCRYSDVGWYELSIQNDGLYYIYAYIFSDNSYYNIYNGGSTNINQGKSTNEYAFICEGNELTFFANGNIVKTVTDTTHNLPEGSVGFGVSSLSAIPVNVDVEYFEIVQP
ncbi:MAG TPA: trypsin-like peptidase domain-containing protein [Anaerolineales bacterium]|nr:trypsin-like peptidase domain-containing protein [Anaerolineales bacterium]